jgi:biotin carboxyl carrier protein
MPGAVVEVTAKPGQQVEKDERMIAIEAMKVQMYINSPVIGVVKEVLVKPGQRIDTGDLLVVFE